MSTDFKKRNVFFSPPDMTETETRLVVEAIMSGWITTGPKTKEFEKCRRPKSIIHAEVFPDTMEPAGIGQYYGTLFIPSYQEFRQKNPGYRVVKTETPEYINNLRNVNEVAKEELEKQGYKVTIGKVGK